MTTRYRVALLGFSAFERADLESYFRLAERSTPHYELLPDIVPLPDTCDFVLADANHSEVLNVVQACHRAADTIYVGTHLAPAAPAEAIAGLTRPLEPRDVLSEFDEAVRRRIRALALPDPPDPEPRKPKPKLKAQARELAAREAQSTDFSNSVLLGGVGSDSMFDHVLVVDDSEIARRFLQQKLQRLGYTVHTASNGASAVELAATRQFSFIFLDVAMDGLDGFEACKQIKRLDWPLDGRTMRGPTVVMLTARTSAVDRIRGMLAGCDAYLTKPLDEDDLMHTLSRFDPCFERVYADTLPPGAVQ